VTTEADRLRAWLNAIMVTRRLSSADVAAVLGVKPATVRMYRAGLRPLTPAAADTLKAWFAAPSGAVPASLKRQPK
jgi:Mn-dependent DtxR family transcriptional regulator